MRTLFCITLLINFFLIGCNQNINYSSTTYLNSAFNYSIDIPTPAYIPNKSVTGAQIFFGNIPFMQKEAKGNEFDILLYGKKSTLCSPALIGVSLPLTLNNKNTLWGKMDFYKDRGMEGWEPSSDESLLVCHGGGMNPPESVYAFCSEHDDKTVVICISQMTDNEAQAKEIFETFRWTE